MRRLVLPLLAALGLLAGCGSERQRPPDVFSVKAPRGLETSRFPAAGMTFERPANWRLTAAEPPAVFTLRSGGALIAGWAYEREEPLPEPGEQLEGAKTRLLRAIAERDRGFRVLRATARELRGSPAIDVRGEQVISKQRLRTRSVHLFEGSVEYVIEALVPPDDYRRVDRELLKPLLRSLELTGELSGPGRSGER